MKELFDLLPLYNRYATISRFKKDNYKSFVGHLRWVYHEIPGPEDTARFLDMDVRYDAHALATDLFWTFKHYNVGYLHKRTATVHNGTVQQEILWLPYVDNKGEVIYFLFGVGLPDNKTFSVLDQNLKPYKPIHCITYLERIKKALSFWAIAFFTLRDQNHWLYDNVKDFETKVNVVTEVMQSFV